MLMLTAAGRGVPAGFMVGSEQARVADMVERVVPGFLPSTCGFRFANCFQPQPVFRLGLPGGLGLGVGNAAHGLCGGMIFAVRDLFEAGLPPPDVSRPPDRGDPLFHLLVRRLLDSFHLPWGPLKYYGWMLLPDRGSRLLHGLVQRTATREWPRVRAELDAGRLAALGLVRLRSANPLRVGINHQVLAYGYRLDERTGGVTLRIYDPNYPLHDRVCLSFGLRPVRAGPLDCSTGGLVRGFFHTPYVPCGLWRWRQAGLVPALDARLADGRLQGGLAAPRQAGQKTQETRA